MKAYFTRDMMGADRVLLVLLVTLLGLTSSQSRERQLPADTKTEPAQQVFTSIVDWYKPPPKSFDSGRGTRLPYQLFAAVPKPRLEEATLLLGDSNIIALTKEQVARLSSTADPDAVLHTRIEEAKEKLLFFQENPVNEKLMTRYGNREVEEQKRRDQRIIKDLEREIKQLRQWEHQLKPYLIKAVALQAGGHFAGVFVSGDLVVSFGAMGSHAVPMERRPVVAFLPKKPRKIYTAVGMME
jgi:hypothetical protein